MIKNVIPVMTKNGALIAGGRSLSRLKAAPLFLV
jgi:hypothetical protein